MKKLGLLLWLTLLIVSVFFRLPSTVYASTDDFVITGFSADYYLTRDDPQGEMRIVEKIDVNFSDFNHGLLRAIPDTYKKQKLQLKINGVTSPSGAPAQFTTYKDAGNTVLRIGDPAQTVTGTQSYTIDYSLRDVIAFYEDHDELYWDINGDQWRQSFDNVTARIHLPSRVNALQQLCFTGGNSSTERSCSLTSDNSTVTATTLRKLQPYETLSVVTAFPKGYFRPPTTADWLKDNYRMLLEAIIPPLLVGAWAFRRWFVQGKDLKGRGVVVPEYAPPKDLSPAEVGVVRNYKLGPRDISATIIDLAIRKYLKIVETTQKKLLKDQKTYSFELLNSDVSALKPYEQEILGGIFNTMSVGEQVTVDSLKNKFYITVQSLQKSIPTDLTKAGYFAVNPRSAGKTLYTAGTILTGVAFALLSWLTVGLLAAASLLFLFALLMPKRTATGVTANDAIKGLKLYMETADKDRLNMLQSPQSPYAETSTEPVRTVDLFEKLLPYAIVLGVENGWAKQFENIYTVPPDWYSGNWSSFNAVYFASSLNDSVSAMGTSFSPPSSSGGSGFSGGSAGGGGGGGGGGGW